MVTKADLNALKTEMDRCAASGDLSEQRRSATFGPLVDFCLWAHDAIVAVAAGAGDTVKPLAEGNDETDPANFAGGTDGNPGASNARVSSGKRSRSRH